MRIPRGLIALLPAVLFSGCNHALPGSANDELSLVSAHPERHIGELVSSFGQVVDIRQTDAGTSFDISTPNFAHSFRVTYAGEIPGLFKGQSAYFLGRVTGSDRVISSAFTGVDTTVALVTVDGIAVKPVGGTPSHPFSSPQAVFRPEEEQLARKWLSKDLELTEDTVRSTRVMPPAVASPARRSAPASEPAYAEASNPAQGGPSPQADGDDLRTFLKLWQKLSPEDRAMFLDLVGRGGAAPQR